MSDMENSKSNGDSPGPIGLGDYVVKQGECLSSIAHRTGHMWTTIWNHPSNSELKKARKNPNILLPGDRLFIPKVAAKETSCDADAQHVFEVASVPVKLRLQFFKDGDPREGERYRVELDGTALSEGSLDRQGKLEVSICPTATCGRVFVGEGQNATVCTFSLGGLDPITELSGVQQRLGNLGFNCEPSGRLDDVTSGALSLFQQMNGLDANGKPDPATQAKLQELHGC